MFTDRIESEFEFKCLQTHDPGAQTNERIRARCLAAFEIQRERGLKRSPAGIAWRRWLEPALAFALSTIYLAASVASSLHLLYRHFR
jgi:hypothetical protein